MNKTEFDMLTRQGRTERRDIVDFGALPFACRHNHTLLYGYDVDRSTWHLYVIDGRIELHIYKNHGAEPETTEIVTYFDVWDNVVPNKRLYPQYCDYDFCSFLQNLGVYLPFTDMDETKHKGPYYGIVAVTEKAA